MNAARPPAALRPVALVLSFAVTFAMLASVNALSGREFRQALLAQAASAPAAVALAPAASTARA